MGFAGEALEFLIFSENPVAFLPSMIDDGKQWQEDREGAEKGWFQFQLIFEVGCRQQNQKNNETVSKAALEKRLGYGVEPIWAFPSA